MPVYENNWCAKNRDHLNRQFRKCVRQIAMIIVKMFDNLKAKINKAKYYGLSSIL